MELHLIAVLCYAFGVVVFLLPVKWCCKQIWVALCKVALQDNKVGPDEEAQTKKRCEEEDEHDEETERNYWQQISGEWRFTIIKKVPHAVKVCSGSALLFAANQLLTESLENNRDSWDNTLLNEEALVRAIEVFSVCVLVAGGLYLVLTFVDCVADYLSSRAEKTKRVVDDQFVSLSRNVLRYTVFGLAILTLLENLNIDTTSLVTVSGILSLSVALAMSDTVKNIFGLLVIVIDRPFVLNDHIKVGAAEGFVHDITLRHTIIKSFNSTKIRVPNAQFIGTNIENFSTQPETKMKLTWVVGYRNAPSGALRELRKSLIAHTRERKDTGGWVDVNTVFVAAGVELTWEFVYFKGEGAVKKEGGWGFYQEARDLKEEHLLFAKDEMARLGLPFATFPVDVTQQNA